MDYKKALAENQDISEKRKRQLISAVSPIVKALKQRRWLRRNAYSTFRNEFLQDWNALTVKEHFNSDELAYVEMYLVRNLSDRVYKKWAYICDSLTAILTNFLLSWSGIANFTMLKRSGKK